MVDVVDGPTRSRMMSGIRGKNTKPELMVRRYLHSKGYRFRLHRKDLPGSPDLVLPKYKVVIFVHGCFWHHHEGCTYASMPSSRPEFWFEKLQGNVARDLLRIDELIQLGWSVVVVWECGLKHAIDDIGALEGLIAKPQRTLSEWPARPPRARQPKAGS